MPGDSPWNVPPSFEGHDAMEQELGTPAARCAWTPGRGGSPCACLDAAANKRVRHLPRHQVTGEIKRFRIFDFRNSSFKTSWDRQVAAHF